MSEAELAWAAGLFDGEGTIWSGIQIRNKPRLGAKNRRIALSLAMTDRYSVEQFARLLDLGFYGPIKSQGKKPLWQARTTGRIRALAAVEKMWPWLGPVKRQQILRAVAKYLLCDYHNPRQHKTHCPRGHPLKEYGNGSRRACLTCNRRATRRWKQRQNVALESISPREG